MAAKRRSSASHGRHGLATVLARHDACEVHLPRRCDLLAREIRLHLRHISAAGVDQQRLMPACADDVRHVGVFVTFGVERAENCDGCHGRRIKAGAGRTATVSHHLLSALHPA
jgi:hypothetical protein